MADNKNGGIGNLILLLAAKLIESNTNCQVQFLREYLNQIEDAQIDILVDILRQQNPALLQSANSLLSTIVQDSTQFDRLSENIMDGLCAQFLGMDGEHTISSTSSSASPQGCVGKCGNYLVVTRSSYDCLDFRDRMTLSVWVAQNNANEGYVIAKIKPQDTRYFALLLSPYSSIGVNVYFTTQRGQRYVRWKEKGLVLDDKKWHHIAVVLYPNEIELFVDGISWNRRCIPSGECYVNGNGSIWIGNRPTFSEFRFMGKMYDLRTYSRCLTPQEIVWLSANKPEQFIPLLLPVEIPKPLNHWDKLRLWTLDDLYEQMELWSNEHYDGIQISTGIVGYTRQNLPLKYMVIGPSRPSKKALLMCAIHGNEKVSTSVGMLMIQALLDMVKGNSVLSHHLRVQECWKDSECSDSVYQTKALQLFQDCEIYFIPAASPDSYESNTRWVDGVNPNRDFPSQVYPELHSAQSSPIQLLQQMHQEIKFNCVMSLHTFGRLIIHPWCDQTIATPDDHHFTAVTSTMNEMAKNSFRVSRGLNTLTEAFPHVHEYKHPVAGTEVDWFYSNGAFPLLIELGNAHWIDDGKNAELLLAKEEASLLFPGFVYFLSRAPHIELKDKLTFHRDAPSLLLGLIARPLCEYDSTALFRNHAGLLKLTWRMKDEQNGDDNVESKDEINPTPVDVTITRLDLNKMSAICPMSHLEVSEIRQYDPLHQELVNDIIQWIQSRRFDCLIYSPIFPSEGTNFPCINIIDCFSISCNIFHYGSEPLWVCSKHSIIDSELRLDYGLLISPNQGYNLDFEQDSSNISQSRFNIQFWYYINRGYERISWTLAMLPNAWHHVAVRLCYPSAKITVDEITEDATMPKRMQSFKNPAVLMIGGSCNDPYFAQSETATESCITRVATITDLRLYNRALTTEEIELIRIDTKL